MKYIKFFTRIGFLVLLCSNPVFAVNVVECEDKDGNRSFQKTCPPGTTMVGKKKLSTGRSKQQDGNVNINATLYVVPNCDTCQEVREFLQARHVSISEKVVDEDVVLQQELIKLTGSLRVPTTVINKQVISGYSRRDLKQALEAAGYSEDSEEKKN